MTPDEIGDFVQTRFSIGLIQTAALKSKPPTSFPLAGVVTKVYPTTGCSGKLLSYSWVPLNQCVNRGPESKYDIKYTACNINYDYRTYPSVDGTCTGSFTQSYNVLTNLYCTEIGRPLFDLAAGYVQTTCNA